jgi:diacylglycerol kinase (CTP)
MSQQYHIPSTPRIISPSPTSSEAGDSSNYFPPVTRSAAKRASSSRIIHEEKEIDSSNPTGIQTRSQSPKPSLSRRRGSGLPPKSRQNSVVQKSEPITLDNAKEEKSNGIVNGHLSPISAAGSSYWRAISRSPSPLGLIPIHRHWRSFVHRHEVPRKVLHVSIGFFTLFLYSKGIQTDAIHPWLLGAVIPIASLDVLRHNSTTFNKAYVRVCGALMRETEVNEKYNGVIWYLLGAWAALRFFPKDVGVMSVMLLSWCDTAASTFGRLYGRYTPRIRKGKSLAGSLAATAVGIATAWLFYGYFVPNYWGIEDSFMFRGRLGLPESVRLTLGHVDDSFGTVTGSTALGIMSVCSGVVASLSELVDVFGLDDNITIPILSAVGLWSFLKVFG